MKGEYGNTVTMSEKGTADLLAPDNGIGASAAAGGSLQMEWGYMYHLRSGAFENYTNSDGFSLDQSTIYFVVGTPIEVIDLTTTGHIYKSIISS